MRKLKVFSKLCSSLLFSSLLLLSLFLTGIIVASCVREENLRPIYDNDPQTQVGQAKQWFEERMYSENYLTAESGMLLYKDWMPDWKNATVHQQSGSKTVEVPLLLKKWIGLISEEIAAEYDRTKDPKYLQNFTKLVIKTDLKSGETVDFIMQIFPSLKYFEQSGNLDSSSYLNVDKQFDGNLFYYDPYWLLVSGFRYSDGRVTGKFNAIDNLADTPVSTRGSDPMQDCFEEITYGWTEWSFNNNDLIYLNNFYMHTEVKCYIVQDNNGNEPNSDGAYSPEGGSVGSGGSGSGSNINNIILDDDLPIIDINDIRIDPKTNCIYTKLTQTDIMSRYLKQFDGDFPVSHLKFTFDPLLNNNINGQTHPPVNYWITISLNPNAAATNPTLIVAKTLMHEVIHAEIYRKLLSISQTNGAINTTDLLRMLEAGDFPGLFDYYSRYAWNQVQHEMMAQHYIDAIAGALKEFDQSQHSDSFYNDMAWGGLEGTTVWSNLSASERNRITNAINTFYVTGDKNCQP